MKKIMYIQNLKSLALIVLLTALSFSCKKLIEIPANPSDKIPTQLVFADSADVMSAVTGVYNGFNAAGTVGIHSGAITRSTGLTGDELTPSQVGDPIATQLYQNAILPTNSITANLWSSAYIMSGLYQINVCLEQIPGSKALSPSLKNQLIGEIKVDRALYYFNLVNLFGPVPLVTSSDYSMTKSLPRASIDDIYKQIITDLTDAQKLLNPAYSSPGRARPNLYTAEALLAKVYLYRGQWASAEIAATSVISSGQYSLNKDLNTVFQDGSSEAIWQLPAIGPYNQTAEAQIFVPYASSAVPTFLISPALLNTFEPGDMRRTNWIGINSISDGKGSSVPYYYPAKYKNRNLNDQPAEDYMIFRLAEIYLIRAEAQAEQGKTTAALADLNQVRNRAGLPNSPATGTTTLLSAIMHERRTELFCEWGNRWYDLKRTGTIDAVLGAEKPTWKPTQALYPVPLAEIQSNPFLKQNPGY
ncbi:RagB/SusD family nutrient uptake outer membrane protein [Mucilaginibacter sp. SG564]|uniref:RagB/SusD family nutrient uptake outer membrane protein n=1 Tax=Mucilaginibacter sp. SG564 TaxID=2587022 RepID=UPI001554499F|nr:RagB/SusD family nutrient uptake outer membrane protein [Mucilaginibacter sp. SG564]NOW94992.1 hypothetical protein [Mucilaginibacter sp. SG564]